MPDRDWLATRTGRRATAVPIGATGTRSKSMVGVRGPLRKREPAAIALVADGVVSDSRPRALYDRPWHDLAAVECARRAGPCRAQMRAVVVAPAALDGGRERGTARCAAAP